MQYRRSVQGRMLLTELETSARTESKRMTNQNTPQLSRMGLPRPLCNCPCTLATKYSSCISVSWHRNILNTRDSENPLVRLRSGPKGAGFHRSDMYYNRAVQLQTAEGPHCTLGSYQGTALRIMYYFSVYRYKYQPRMMIRNLKHDHMNKNILKISG
jgi:hypothetical protein